MAERMMMQREGDGLVPADQASRDELRKLPENTLLGVTAVKPRNLRFHRKVFSLVQLAFQYWNPTDYLTTVERSTVRTLADYLCHHGLDAEAVSNLCAGFLGHLNERRGERLEAEKSFEAFRDFITVEAGFCDTVISPAGPRRVPKSWAFANMDEDTFQALYKQIFTVCWELILKQTFSTPDAAEAAAEQLLSYG